MTDDIPKKINCFRCAYFSNTWNPKFPRACRYFGFKTKQLPSVVVLQTTGTQCISFEEKFPVKNDHPAPKHDNYLLDIEL